MGIGMMIAMQGKRYTIGEKSMWKTLKQMSILEMMSMLEMRIVLFMTFLMIGLKFEA